MSDAAIPLVDRGAGAVLFRRPDGPRTAAAFLRDVASVAAALPPAAHLLNLCRDRYTFAVTLCAAVVRRQVCLLTSRQTSAQIFDIAARFPDTASASDDPTSARLAQHSDVRIADLSDTAMPDIAPVPADLIAAIVFTSGSTGVPVGHAKSWGALAARSRAAAARFGQVDAAVSIVGTVPPHHMYGFETTVLQPLHGAWSSWCGAGFYPADIRAALAAVPAPRLLVTTPLQLRAALQAELDLPALAGIISATAPLERDLAAAAEARWGTPVREIFGATEVGSIASRRTVSDDDWTLYDGVRIDPRDGRHVVHAPHAVPFALADVIVAGTDGRFRLIGRASDMVKLGGRRGSLAGLTKILTEIDGVQDGVFLAPDDLGQRPTARLLAYVIAPERSADEILAELRARVDPVFLPRRVVRLDALPRNDVGKLQREALLRLAAAGA